MYFRSTIHLQSNANGRSERNSKCIRTIQLGNDTWKKIILTNRLPVSLPKYSVEFIDDCQSEDSVVKLDGINGTKTDLFKDL